MLFLIQPARFFFSHFSSAHRQRRYGIKENASAINKIIAPATPSQTYSKARPAVSLVGYIGNTGYKYTDLGYTAKWNYIVVGARGTYHYNGFTDVPNLDIYGGAMLAYNIVKYKTEGGGADLSDNYGSGVGFSGFLGGRWFFTDNIGAYAELGYGVSVLAVGATFKF